MGRRMILKTLSLPCHGQGNLPPAQGAANPIQPGLGHSQGCSSAGTGTVFNNFTHFSCEIGQRLPTFSAFLGVPGQTLGMSE